MRRGSPALKSPKNPWKKIKKEETEETRSHHVKTRRCIPGCEAVVWDIKCHLRVHAKRGELHTNNVNGHAEIMRHGERKFVTSANNPEIRGEKPRTRREKWCPVAGCKTISARQDKHLLRAHHLTGNNQFLLRHTLKKQNLLSEIEITEPKPNLPGSV